MRYVYAFLYRGDRIIENVIVGLYVFMESHVLSNFTGLKKYRPCRQGSTLSKDR